MQEESKFIPQMQAIRNDEIDKLNEVKKELKMTQKILTNMSEAFFELAHFLSKNPNLSESTGFMANTSKQSDVAKFEKMCDEIKSDLESIFLDNPYTMILSMPFLYRASVSQATAASRQRRATRTGSWDSEVPHASTRVKH